MVGFEIMDTGAGADARRVGWSTRGRVRIGATLISPSLQVDPSGRGGLVEFVLG